MGEFVIPTWQKIVSWIAALVIIGLNMQMVFNQLKEMIVLSEYPLVISFTIVPLCLFCFLMLVYILLVPFVMKKKISRNMRFHEQAQELAFEKVLSHKKIAISVDFSTSDNKAINKAVTFGGKDAGYLLVHILESTNAVVYGENAFDMEREQDYQLLKQYQQQLEQEGYHCDIALGFGNPKSAIPHLVNKNECDMLVMGTHGHKTFMDILLGTTIESVRHNIKVPLVLV